MRYLAKRTKMFGSRSSQSAPKRARADTAAARTWASDDKAVFLKYYFINIINKPCLKGQSSEILIPFFDIYG
jgi:hypothetical protein